MQPLMARQVARQWPGRVPSAWQKGMPCGQLGRGSATKCQTNHVHWGCAPVNARDAAVRHKSTTSGQFQQATANTSQSEHAEAPLACANVSGRALGPPAICRRNRFVHLGASMLDVGLRLPGGRELRCVFQECLRHPASHPVFLDLLHRLLSLWVSFAFIRPFQAERFVPNVDA